MTTTKQERQWQQECNIVQKQLQRFATARTKKAKQKSNNNNNMMITTITDCTPGENSGVEDMYAGSRKFEYMEQKKILQIFVSAIFQSNRFHSQKKNVAMAMVVPNVFPFSLISSAKTTNPPAPSFE